MRTKHAVLNVLLIAVLVVFSLAWIPAPGVSAGWKASPGTAPKAQAAAWEDFTFAAWVYYDGGATGQRIFDFGQDASHSMYLSPATSEGMVRFGIINGGAAQVLDAPFTWPHGMWVHMAVTLEGDNGALYLGGNPHASGTITLDPQDVMGANLFLGKSQGSDPYFDGAIDEVAVFDRALSAAEITQVSNSGWPEMYGKLLALHLDDYPVYGEGSLYDASGQRHHGVLFTSDADNKTISGHPGQALALDGLNDYVTLPATLGDTPWMVIDSDALSIERDGDGNPQVFKGLPFITDVSPEGIAQFRLAGDLALADGDTLAGVGSRGISVYVGGEASIAAGAVIDVSGVGTTPGPGGGAGGLGHTGGAGAPATPLGDWPNGGYGGSGGGAPYGSGGGGGWGYVDSGGGVNGGAGADGGGYNGGSGVQSPGSGGTAGDGGMHGSGGQGGLAQPTGGYGGGGGQGSVLGVNNGSAGGTGWSGNAAVSAGTNGYDGGNGAGGLNTGAGPLISGGGGGGGGRSGGGGGAGGQGSSGSGGGGGGGGSANLVSGGGGGGYGGYGGPGGEGGAGGYGGKSGVGGAGAGAFEIIALGWMDAAGSLLARGGEGSDEWEAGQPGSPGQYGQEGGDPNSGWTGNSGSRGGDGGHGGWGGAGASGGYGGKGGAGGGGAGGTVKLAAFQVSSTGASMDGSGGDGGDPLNSNDDGGPGRFLLGQTFALPFAGTLTNAPEQDVPHLPTDANPFINGNPETPYMPFLAGGPDIYGRVEGLNAADLGAFLADAPYNAGLALLLLDGDEDLPDVLAWDYPGYDMLLVINPSCRAQSLPYIGVGAEGLQVQLRERGPQKNPFFGGSGPTLLSELGAGEVFITLIPEGAQYFNLRLRDDDLSTKSIAPAALTYGQPAYVNTLLACPRSQFSACPATGHVPVTVNFSDESLGNPLPTTWAWDFGDGGTSAEQNPTYTYEEAGIYTVTLTTTNTLGTDTLTVPACVTAEPPYQVFLPSVAR